MFTGGSRGQMQFLGGACYTAGLNGTQKGLYPFQLDNRRPLSKPFLPLSRMELPMPGVPCYRGTKER